MKTSNNSRDTQLDVYRALVMIHIVCVIHTTYWMDITNDIVRSIILFEMPVIFFIAGAAMSLRPNIPSLRNNIVRVTKRILVPYYIFLPVLYIFIAIITFTLSPSVSNYVDIRTLNVYDVVKTLLTGGSTKIPFFGYTWFISCYFIIACSLPIQVKIMRHMPRWLYLIIFIAIVIIQSFVKLNILEYEIKNLALYNFFFIAGYIYYKKIKLSWVYIIGIATTAVTIYGFIDGYLTNMTDHKFPADYHFLIFGTAWICLFSILFSKVRLPYPKIIEIWNTRGYTIYLYQIIGAYLVYWVAEEWICNISNMAVRILLCALIAFIANTVLSYVFYPMEIKIKSLLGISK